MELTVAERLAGSIDPKGLTSLQNRNGDPAVGHAVAEQFGAYLMQGLMQNADGSAISMADGTGSGPVSTMFANAISRVAMAGDKLGLADMIYQSIQAKQDAATKTVPDASAPAPTASTAAAPPAAANDAATPPAPAATAPSEGAAAHAGPKSFSLSPYRQGNGARPIGPALNGNRVNLPPIPSTVSAAPAAPVAAVATSAAAKPAAAPAVAATPPAAPPPPPVQAATAAAQNWAMKTVMVPRFGHVQLPVDGPVTAQPAPNGTATDTASAASPAAAPAGVTTFSRTPSFTRFLPLASVPRNYGLPWSHGAGGPSAPLVTDPPATPQASAKDAETFAQQLGPSLQQAAAKLGVSPRILLAQAALETGWGRSVVGNNIFGVKAGGSWQGASVTARTHEMTGGQMVAQDGSFRAYSSTAQAVEDYVTLVTTSGRYRPALGAGDNVAAYARALSAGGYASDQDYAAKLMAVANSPVMDAAAATLAPLAAGRPLGTQG